MINTLDAEGTREKRTTISTKTLAIMARRARDNPECETTIAVFESVEETMVFRIFRQRHTDDKNPLDAADQWTRWVKKHCTSISGELAATAVWTDADGGSVLVAITGQGIIAITGQGIIAREETGLVIFHRPRPG